MLNGVKSASLGDVGSMTLLLLESFRHQLCGGALALEVVHFSNGQTGAINGRAYISTYLLRSLSVLFTLFTWPEGAMTIRKASCFKFRTFRSASMLMNTNTKKNRLAYNIRYPSEPPPSNEEVNQNRTQNTRNYTRSDLLSAPYFHKIL